MAENENESNGVYICGDCGQSFATDDLLKTHASSEHPIRIGNQLRRRRITDDL